MKICILGSGSSGNSIYVESGGFSLLVDAGLSRRDLQGRLSSLGLSLSGIRAILISHEHHDHIRGLEGLCKNHHIPVYANRSTAVTLIEKGILDSAITFFKTGIPLTLGPCTVHPFSVPHDASDPVGFVIADGDARIGIVTDCGHSSATVRQMLRGCGVLVIEANHDQDLLDNGTRPVSLKERIRSDVGHLSNECAAQLLAEIASDALSDVFLAHLSQECNIPESARLMVERSVRAAGHGHVKVRLTHADRVSDLVEYHAPRREALPV